MSGKSDFLYRSRGIAYFLFNFLFEIFWNNIYLNYVPKFGYEDLV